MHKLNLLAILTVISGTVFTSAAPLLLAVDVAATVDASVRRGLAANRLSGALESLHDRGDTTSSAKRDATAVDAHRVSVLALTKRLGNLIHDSAMPDTTIGKRQPQPIAAQAQVDAVANVDLLLKRDPATVQARAQAQVDTAANVDLLGGRRDLAMMGHVGNAGRVSTQKRRYVSDD